VQRTYAFEVLVKEGDRVLSWRDDWRIHPITMDGSGQGARFSDAGKGRRIRVTKPGRYRFSFPEVDGYLPVPEQHVLVERDRVIEHVVLLQRRP
jgi:hypothetical protein